MKKLILGIAWQIMGFFGAIILMSVATLEGPWNYNGIDGLCGALLGTDLMLPLVFCVVLFLCGCLLCSQVFKEELEKEKS